MPPVGFLWSVEKTQLADATASWGLMSSEQSPGDRKGSNNGEEVDGVATSQANESWIFGRLISLSESCLSGFRGLDFERTRGECFNAFDVLNLPGGC